MANKKENLLSKTVLKNYDNELEKILETKNFDERVKSILLEILYKIEISYKDYQIVKRDVETKEEYITQLLDAIKNSCEEIKLVTPTSKEGKNIKENSFVIDKEAKKIVCYPVERKLLYAVAQINKKDQITNQEDTIINSAISNVINVGNSINVVEPFRDFNGWSWTIIKKEIENIECNLIYQNLRILVGNELLTNWIKNEEYIIDYYEMLKDELEERYGKTLKEKIISTLEKILVLIIRKDNNDIEKSIQSKLKTNKAELKKYSDKTKYIKELTNQKEKITNRIREIDKIISSKQKLQLEFKRRNEELSPEESVFNIKFLEKILREEKEKLKNELKEKNNFLKPSVFLNYKKEIEKKCLIYEDGDVEEELLELQKIFLEAFLVKIEKAKTKEEIIDIIYTFRYYQILPFNDKISIFENENLSIKINEVKEEILKKAIKNKVINEKVGKELFSCILKTKIIKLEEIYAKVEENDKKIIIELSENKNNGCEEKLEIERMDVDENNISRGNKNGNRFKLFS